MLMWVTGYILGQFFGFYRLVQNRYGAVWRERNFCGKLVKWGIILMIVGCCIGLATNGQAF